MKKEFKDILFTLTLAFALSLVFSSCSDDDFVQTNAGISEAEQIADNKNYISMPLILPDASWKGNEMPISKSTLNYDYRTGQAAFSWTIGDKIIVYPVKYVEEGEQKTYEAGSSTSQEWEIKAVKQSGTKSIGIFEGEDDDVTAHFNESYIAVYPYIRDDRDYRDIPITYEGQKQKESPKIKCYLDGIGYYGSASADRLEEYVASEEAACENLAKFDYLVDKERAATDVAGMMHFEMSRLGSVVRFFMKVPEKVVFDSLQLYNATKKFVHTTTLNGGTGEYAATPTKDSHVTSLQLGDYGFDYYKSAVNDDNYYGGSIGWVMTAYMMIAPIDLSAAETENSMLYLIGREPLYYTNVTDYNYDHSGGDIDEAAFNALTAAQKIKLYTNRDDYNTDNNKNLTAEQFAALTDDAKMMVYADVDAFNAAKETSLTAEQFAALTPAQKMTRYTRKCYKATNLAKYNITAGGLYQWTIVGLNPDQPITFEEISIETWKTGTEFTNADGTGTEDW